MVTSFNFYVLTLNATGFPLSFISIIINPFLRLVTDSITKDMFESGSDIAGGSSSAEGGFVRYYYSIPSIASVGAVNCLDDFSF